MFVQLNPPLPVTIEENGQGYAIAVIDYGQEHNLIWVTALNATGEIWCAPNPKVRVQANWTMNRMSVSLNGQTQLSRDPPPHLAERPNHF